MRRERGFTIVELVITMVVVGAIAGILVPIINNMATGYDLSHRRADLVDEAELVASSIARELREALPNSIRVGNNNHTIEFLRVSGGGRYRRAVTPGDTSTYNDALDFTQPDDKFEVLGGLVQRPGSSIDGQRLVINNTNIASGSMSNAYTLSNTAVIKDLDVSSTTPARRVIELDTSKQFPLASTSQRFYVVDTPVSYTCDPSTGMVRRYQGYPVTANHASVDTHSDLAGQSGVKVSVVSSQLGSDAADCRFEFDAGALRESAVVTLRFGLAPKGSGSAHERVRIFQQAHLSNAP